MYVYALRIHLEMEMATHSSILDYRILWTEEPGGLPSMGSHRVGHNWSNLEAAACDYKINIQFVILLFPTIHVELAPPLATPGTHLSPDKTNE